MKKAKLEKATVGRFWRVEDVEGVIVCAAGCGYGMICRLLDQALVIVLSRFCVQTYFVWWEVVPSAKGIREAVSISTGDTVSFAAAASWTFLIALCFISSGKRAESELEKWIQTWRKVSVDPYKHTIRLHLRE